MYLARTLHWHGQTLPHGRRDPRRRGDAREAGRPRLRAAAADRRPPLAQRRRRPAIPAHEFHYSSLENLPPDTRFAYRVQRGHGIDGRTTACVQHNLLASYAHLRSVGGYDWAARFVAFVRDVQRSRRAAASRSAAPTSRSAP